MRPWTRTLAAGLTALLVSTTASAVEVVEANRDQLWYSSATFARVNPLGLISYFKLGYRRRLEISDTAFGRDTYFFIGPSLQVSPAFGRIGVHAEIEPVALLRFSATYEFVGYFGSFDQIMGFPGSNVNFSDSELARLGDLGNNAQRLGGVFTASAQFKFKLGPVAVRSTLVAAQYDLALPTGDLTFYDQTYDRLVSDGGWLIQNDNDVMAVLEHLRAGVRYTYSNSFHADAELEGDGAIPHHRLGPLFAWQFHDHNDRARRDRPTIFVVAQWWLQHPYRTGQDSHQGLPLIAAGLSFEGDLSWKGPPRGKARVKKSKK